MAHTWHRMARVTLLLAGLLIVSACGDTGGMKADYSSGPAEAVRLYYNALLSGEDDPAKYVCAAYKKNAEPMKNYYASQRASGTQYDTTGLKFELSKQMGNEAQVKLSGKLTVIVNGKRGTSEMPAAQLPVRNENGWKVCGG